MLSYQHGYHAGSFADVIKHFTLSRLLNYITKKEKPVFYLETHSGKGLYNLTDPQTLKTGEAGQGVHLFWPKRAELPEVFQDYINAIAKINPDKQLNYYPGSPLLAIHALRVQDRLYCCELHPKEYEALTQLPTHPLKVHFSNEDGLHALKSLLPPPEKRALVFIDPSYEIKEEYKEIPKILNTAFKKFSQGTYCLWYPIVDKVYTERLLRGLQEIPCTDKLHIQFHLGIKNLQGMTGCGLWIINPPYTLESDLNIGLAALKKIFTQGMATYCVE